MARRRVVALGALWAVATGAIVAIQGCYGRVCEGSVAFFGGAPGEGRMIDENTWESVPIDGQWLHFPGARIYAFDIPQLGGRAPGVILPYLSPSPEPLKTGQSFTLGSGNIAELYNVRGDHVEVRNGTCAEYYLRLVVEADPFPPPPPSDAGTD